MERSAHSERFSLDDPLRTPADATTVYSVSLALYSGSGANRRALAMNWRTHGPRWGAWPSLTWPAREVRLISSVPSDLFVPCRFRVGCWPRRIWVSRAYTAAGPWVRSIANRARGCLNWPHSSDARPIKGPRATGARCVRFTSRSIIRAYSAFCAIPFGLSVNILRPENRRPAIKSGNVGGASSRQRVFWIEYAQHCPDRCGSLAAVCCRFFIHLGAHRLQACIGMRSK